MEKELQQLLEKVKSELEGVTSRLVTLSDNGSKAELAEGEHTELVSLREQVAEMASDEHETAIIQEWATRMTPEAYLALGQKLGIDVTMMTEEPAAKVEEPPVKAEVVYQDPNDPEYKAVPALKLWVLPTKPAAADKV